MIAVSPACIGDRAQLALIADGLAAAVAISLPWSTSATAVLIVLWLVALLPTLDVATMRRELATAAGGLPVLLWALAVLGMLWADVPWGERFEGLGGFHKLLVVPLLLAQFRRSTRGWWAVTGFFAALVALLVVSWALVLLPGLPWRGKVIGNGTWVGVPVKDYVSQSGAFALCTFGMLAYSVDIWRRGQRWYALSLAVLAAIFLANIAFVATGRTTLLVIAVFVVLFGFWEFRGRAMLAVLLAAGVIATAVWASSDYLRSRVENAFIEIHQYWTADQMTSSGVRLEFWRRSAEFVMGAPVLGHGTGTIRELFKESATGGAGPESLVTPNPHNQYFAVAIQLGLVGLVCLLAMWLSHLALFSPGGLVPWFGMMVVVQNIVSCLFNSHLFDFTQGWLYVFGVGVIGGMALRRREAQPPARLDEAA